MRFMTLRKTGRETVPETPVEFVDGLSRRIESVDGVTSVGQRSHLTPIVRMLNECRDQMGFPGEPFEGHWRLIDTSTAPRRQWCWLEGSGSIGTDCKPTRSLSDRRDRTWPWLQARV